MKGKFGKLTKYTVSLILLTLLAAGIKCSIDSKSKVESVTRQLNVLTDDIIKTVGNAPSIESIQRAKQIIDDRKQSIREGIKSLRDDGKLRNYSVTEDCSADKCSETAMEIDACYKSNHNKIAEVHNNFLNIWRTNISKSNKLVQELVQKLDETSSAKEKRRLETEVKKINEEFEANVALLDELGSLVKSYESITLF